MLFALDIDREVGSVSDVKMIQLHDHILPAKGPATIFVRGRTTKGHPGLPHHLELRPRRRPRSVRRPCPPKSEKNALHLLVPSRPRSASLQSAESIVRTACILASAL